MIIRNERFQFGTSKILGMSKCTATIENSQFIGGMSNAIFAVADTTVNLFCLKACAVRIQ